MWLKETHVIVFVVKVNISRNGGKGVANCIMSSSVFIAMNTTSMGCVHTHQKMRAIEGWDNLNHIQSVMEKIEEDN
jgi:hypothetical protein